MADQDTRPDEYPDRHPDPSIRSFATLLAVLLGGSLAFGCLGGWAGIIGIAVVLLGTAAAAVTLL